MNSLNGIVFLKLSYKRYIQTIQLRETNIKIAFKQTTEKSCFPVRVMTKKVIESSFETNRAQMGKFAFVEETFCTLGNL